VSLFTSAAMLKCLKFKGSQQLKMAAVFYHCVLQLHGGMLQPPPTDIETLQFSSCLCRSTINM
jgi:hypothetical protein